MLLLKPRDNLVEQIHGLARSRSKAFLRLLNRRRNDYLVRPPKMTSGNPQEQ